MNQNRNVFRIGKTIVSGLLVLSLVMGNGTFSQAEKITKQESVYVSADASGNTTEITVTDCLKNAGVNGVLEDKSDLKDIKNVKGEETFEQENDEVKWNAGNGDITYEGTTEKKLPVRVNISYQLDGKEIAPEELVGKSGTVSITVSYTNLSKVEKEIDGKKETLFTPFFMATILVLPTDHFSEVEVDHGKVMGEGSSQMVFGYGLPGLADSLDIGEEEIADKLPQEFTVTAKVEDFSLDSTITYASADLLSEMDVEDSDTLDDLEEGIDTLVDSSAELVKGSQKISDSMGSFQKSFTEYSKGEKGLNQGIKSLASGGKKLKKGIKSYTSGTDALAKGITSYVNAAKQLTDGNQSLYQAVKSMPQNYKSFSQGLNQYTTGVDQLADEKTAEALKTGASGVSAGISSLNSSLTSLESSYTDYATVIATIRSQAAACTDDSQKQELLNCAGELEKLYGKQKESVTELKKATAQDSSLKKGAEEVASGVGKVMDGVQTLSKNSQTLRSADSQMSTGINALAETSKKLSEGGAKLSKYNKELTNGAKQLKKAGKSVNSGTDGIIKGILELKKGSSQLHAATGKISEGLALLNEGAEALSTGMRQFDKKGIQKIKEKYENDFLVLKERLSALIDCSGEYNNFSGIGDGMDGDVKFIIETEKIGGDE